MQKFYKNIGNSNYQSDQDLLQSSPRESNYSFLKNQPAFTSPKAEQEFKNKKKERYINPKIEAELVEFKEEIEEKFAASEMNNTYKFQRMADAKSMRNSIVK